MKERLTGAIILVALIVLLVPELLTGPIRSSPRAVASAAGEPPLRSYTINLGDEPRSKPAEPQSAPASSPAPVPVAAPAASPAQDTAPVADAPAAAPAPPPPIPRTKSESPPAHAARTPSAAATPATQAASGSGAWMVQLGSFASRANADRFAQKLKSQGFTSGVSQASSGRHLYRVRVGPAHDHEAAVQLQSKLQAAGHVGALVPK